MAEIATPIYDQMVDEGLYPKMARAMTDTEFNRVYTKEKSRWADLSQRLAGRDSITLGTSVPSRRRW